MKWLTAAALLALALGATASPAHAMLKGHWGCVRYVWAWNPPQHKYTKKCIQLGWVLDPQVQSFEPHRPFPGPPHPMFLRPRPMFPFGRRF